MLGTHSEPHSCQMSHICDICPLRVKIANIMCGNSKHYAWLLTRHVNELNDCSACVNDSAHLLIT